MTFAIESGITKPISNRGRKATEFPFGSMDVGDSFLIPVAHEAGTEDHKKAVDSWRRKLLNSKKRFAQEYEGKFTTAVVAEGLRVWRTE